MSHGTKKHDELILSIDAGTQSIRAALVDLAGNISDMVKTPIEPYFADQPGWAEQHPDYYWQQLCLTCKELFDKSSSSKDAIVGVALASQRATMINVDKDGNALRPAIVWLDQRKADSSEVLPSYLKPLLKVIGLHGMLDDAARNCESNWIRQNQPEIWDKTHKYLFLSGYFTFKLTGEFIDSCGNGVGYVPSDIKTGQWAGKLDLKNKFFPIDREKLPDLIKPTELLGHITKKAAQETGIPEGLPMIASANDKGCEIIGAGCLTPETACISLGTTSTVNMQNSKYVELRPFWPPFPAAVPDHYYTEVSVMRGFWMVTWFKEEFGLQERLEALEEGIAPELLLEKLIKGVPAGSMGLVLQPNWSPAPNIAQYAKGSIVGFGDLHTRAHLYRAIVEGLIYSLKEGTELSEKKNKVSISGLRVSGGGSQSDTVMQIVADVFGMTAERPHTNETSALGAAIDAAVGLKLYPDFPEALKAMTRVGRAFEPIKENSEIYEELYSKVFLKMYKLILPLSKEIQRITGYPE